ncbi:unnamed protein product [Lota lota]
MCWLLVGLCGLALVHLSAPLPQYLLPQGSHVTQKPRFYGVKASRSVIIVCLYELVTPLTVNWFWTPDSNPEAVLPLWPGNNVVMENKGKWTNAFLLLLNVTPSDSGVYYCKVNDIMGPGTGLQVMNLPVNIQKAERNSAVKDALIILQTLMLASCVAAPLMRKYMPVKKEEAIYEDPQQDHTYEGLIGDTCEGALYEDISTYAQTALNNSFVFDCTEMPEGFIIWAFFSILVFLLGSPLCIWVLWDLVDKHYRGGQPCTPNTLFTLNVTVMDVVFLTFLLADALNFLLWQNEILTNFNYLTFSLNFSGRPLLMACVCLDCYMAILHPLRYRSQTLSSRAIITAVIWLASLVNGGVFIMNPNLLAKPGMWWPFLSSLVVIVYCDCCILWTLSRFRMSRGESHQQKKRALHIISVTNYLPSMIAVIFGRLIFQSEEKFYCLIILPAIIPLQLTSVLMPTLYLRKVGKLCGIMPTFCNNI